MPQPVPHLTRLHPKVLFHVHTHLSLDAWIRPKKILEYARSHGIGLVIVTDHNSCEGSRMCAALARDGDPVFPLSAEYRSIAGDIVATFLSHSIDTRAPLEIIDEAHQQGGLAILPHPFKGSRFSDRVFEQVDIIEVFNARCTDEQNARALEVARALSKPGIAGADAHFASELGLVVNSYAETSASDWQSIILTTRVHSITAKTTIRAIRRSQMLKAVRQLRPVNVVKNGIRWVQASSLDTP